MVFETLEDFVTHQISFRRLERNDPIFHDDHMFSLRQGKMLFFVGGENRHHKKKQLFGASGLLTWIPDCWRLSNYAICQSDVSIVQPYFNKSSRESSCRSVLRRTLKDVHFSTSWILISLLMSHRIRNSVQVRIEACEIDPSAHCCTCRKACVSYMFFGVSFLMAFSKSLLSLLPGR